MKALSMHPIYAVQITAGIKKTENRSWQTDYRGSLLICSSQFNDGQDCPRGYALCVAELWKITGKAGAWRWWLRDVHPVKPFKVKGKLHLFDVPDDNIVPLAWEDTGEKLTAADFDDVLALWEKSGICKLPKKLSSRPGE